MSVTACAIPSRFRPSACLTTGTIRPLPVGELDREPEVDPRPRDDLLAADLAVDPRVLLERLDDRAGDEDQVRRVDAVGLLVLGLELVADLDDAGHVDLDRARHVGGGVERAAHVLGDPAAHRVHRLELLAGCGGHRLGRRRRRRLRRRLGCRRRLGSGSRSGLRAREREPERQRAPERRRALPAEARPAGRTRRSSGCPSSSRARRGPCPGRSRRRRRARRRCARRPARRSSCRSPGPRPAVVAGAARARASAPFDGRRLGRLRDCPRARARRAGASAGAPASPPITASFVPTSTVSPSWTRIWVTTPLAGLGTSVSTLSVEISSSDSSASISSPTCLSHFVIVPSETETPICGMTTSTASVVAISTRPAPSVP